jgi:hypothetical protein
MPFDVGDVVAVMGDVSGGEDEVLSLSDSRPLQRRDGTNLKGRLGPSLEPSGDGFESAAPPGPSAVAEAPADPGRMGSRGGASLDMSSLKKASDVEESS